jgi:hypothetical protein
MSELAAFFSFHFVIVMVPGSLLGLTISDDGGLDQVDESFSSQAIFSLSSTITASSARIFTLSCSISAALSRQCVPNS